MKKIGNIMKEMGFREEAPNSVKEAFIKHLIKVSTGVELETPSAKRQAEIKKLVFAEPAQQLSFFKDLKVFKR